MLQTAQLLNILPQDLKKKCQFDPDTYLGWRGIAELSEVSGEHNVCLQGGGDRSSMHV